MTEYQVIAVNLGLFAVLWIFRPKGNFSKTVKCDERDYIIQLCKDDPSIIQSYRNYL